MRKIRICLSSLLLVCITGLFVSIGYDDKYEDLFAAMETNSKEKAEGMWSSH